MEAKEYAEELIYKFINVQSDKLDYGIDRDMAKECARISVISIITELGNTCSIGNVAINEKKCFFIDVLNEII